MYFKPRIFISSTLAGKLGLRKKLEQLFIDVGAEPLLYESSLTPSINPYTYRNDIKESDFVIFIIDDINGTPTSSGVSGTMEEIKIARELNKPNHTYIKHCIKDGEMDEIENSMKKAGVSFYYYENEAQLLKKIKSTIFTISREAAMSKVNEETFTFKKLVAMSYNTDYKQALDIIAINDRMYELEKNTMYDRIFSNLFIACTEPIILTTDASRINFINPILEGKLVKLCNIAKEYSNKHCNNFSSKKGSMEFSVPCIGTISVYSVSIDNHPFVDKEWYENKLKEYDAAYEDFVSYIKNIKVFIDVYTYDVS
jgi:hypothetical protein